MRSVLFICDYAAPFEGGFITSLIRLSDELKNKGYQLTYIFPREISYISKLRSKGEVLIIESFAGKKMDVKLLSKAFNLVKQKNIDIIHTNFGLATFLAGTIIASILRIKHVAHVRSISVNIEKGTGFKRRLKKIFFSGLHYLSKNKYIAISNEIKTKLIENQGYPSSSITVVFNAVENNNEISGPLIGTLPDIPDHKFIVGMVSHFSPYKDHQTLVLAAEELVKVHKDLYFICVGGELLKSKISYRDIVMNMVNKKGLMDYFTFTGELKNTAQIIKKFNVGCLISHKEGFGNAAAEYMLYSKPVIATNTGGLKDLIDDGRSGFLIQPGDFRALSYKIDYLYSHQETAKEMGCNGFERVTTHFNMNKFIQGVLKVYEGV